MEEQHTERLTSYNYEANGKKYWVGAITQHLLCTQSCLCKAA